MEQIRNQLDQGNLYVLDGNETNQSKDWYPHPGFKGVSIKNLITGVQTNGQFSSHWVKVEPGNSLDEHIHDGKTELHEVIEGSGRFYLNEKEWQYKPGDSAVIPQNIKHKVVAGETGIFLLAKFIPALL